MPITRTTIDADGRLVIPEEIRRQANLQPGDPLEVRWQDGRIEIEPVFLPIRLVRKGHLVVAVTDEPVEPLTLEQVEAIRQAIRDEREQLD
jgi:AbrB family looped-hinge helix DNA binding protein